MVIEKLRYDIRAGVGVLNSEDFNSGVEEEEVLFNLIIRTLWHSYYLIAHNVYYIILNRGFHKKCSFSAVITVGKVNLDRPLKGKTCGNPQARCYLAF